jgi:hypothetical protein
MDSITDSGQRISVLDIAELVQQAL